MIITSCYHDDFIMEVIKTGIPVVLVDYYLPTEDINSVLIDNVDGIIKGMRYLSSLGHRRVAYLTGDINERGSRDRFSGYQKAVQMFNLEDDSKMILNCDFSIRGAYSVMKNFLSKRSDYPSPPLSTIHVRKRTMGRLSVQRLFRIVNSENIEYNKILVSPVLIERESTKKV